MECFVSVFATIFSLIMLFKKQQNPSLHVAIRSIKQRHFIPRTHMHCYTLSSKKTNALNSRI